MANYSHERWDQSIAEHEQSMDALRRRDSAELAGKLEHHNAATCNAVLGELRLQQTAIDELTADN